MIKYVLIIVVVVFLIVILIRLVRNGRQERKEAISIKVKKTTVAGMNEDDVKIRGNEFQCPICNGEYVFYHLYNAVEKGWTQKETLIRSYIEFNQLEVDPIELDRAKLKHSK